MAIYDANGNLKAKYLYDAWGNCTITPETTDNTLANANPKDISIWLIFGCYRKGDPMNYLIIKKYFRFLVNEFGFKIAYKQRLGFTRITYENATVRITISGHYEDIRITASDVNSFATYYDETRYCDEFKVEGSYTKKAIAAAQWLRHQLEQDIPLVTETGK